MTTLEQLGSEKYVLLTTFRKDGRAVATPLWVVPDGAGLGFWTVAGSGKTKRIRNSGRVTVEACDMRGRPKGGGTVDARARMGDMADKARVADGLKKKYGLVGRLSMIASRIRRGADGTVAIIVN
jgi:hypothetical protein